MSYCFSAGAGYTLCRGFRGAGVTAKGCAYVPTTEAWLRATGQWLGRVDPEPGDIAIYNWDGGPPDHIGIVESGGDGGFTAVEGNTAVGADSNGGEVMRRERTLDDVDGFGRVHSSRTRARTGRADPSLTLLPWRVARGAPPRAAKRVAMRWPTAARALASVVARARTSTGVVAAATALALVLAAGGSAAPDGASAGKAAAFTGFAFDSCNAPSTSALTAWLGSPYRALGIYIGGSNRGCPNPQLTSDWAASAVATGWGLIPIYVGLQAPCVSASGLAKISPSIAASQGTAAADDAAGDAGVLGLGSGSPIYFDMEGYAINNAACSQSVEAFVSAWVNELHALGHLAGVYGSAASTIRDLQVLASTASSPDDVWIADWNGEATVFGDPYVSDTLWTNHQRLHQYRGGHHETWNGVTLDVDSNYVDGAVVGSVGSPQLPPQPPPLDVTSQSAAGSVSSVDGISTVSWPAGAFNQSVVVSLTPALPTQPVTGFAGGGYGVQLEVQQTVSAALRKGFSVPAHDPHRPPRGAPGPDDLERRSELGAARSALLGCAFEGREGRLLSEPRRLGGHRDDRRRVLRAAPRELAATHAAGAERPLHPRAARALVAQDDRRQRAGDLLPAHDLEPALALDPRADDGGRHLDPPQHPSVYRVIATDAAGKVSEPSKALVVLPSKRPKKLPKTIPRWAFDIFGWQQGGHNGSRPAAPKILPDWYWSWAAWHAAPFHFR